MTKITLNPVGDLTSPTTAQAVINNNFDVIEAAFDNTYSRDGTAPNQLQANLDANSFQITNLPAPLTVDSPLRLADANTLNGGGTIATVPAGGTTGQSLQKKTNADYDMQWASGSGGVTSVGLSLPNDFTVTNSPVTTSGTLTATWVNAPTGTGAVVRTSSPTLTTPTLTSPTMTTPVLGTPASGNLTNCTSLPVASGISGLGTGVATFLGTPSSANLAAAVTNETGSGNLVFATSPTLVTPVLGTPSSGTLTSCTGLPISTGVSGLGTGVATFLGTPSSANLISAVTDETGTGSLVFGTSPTITTANLVGTATNNNASAGSVGEYVSSTVAAGSPVALTNGTAANVTSISLTAGDWDVWGGVGFTPAGTTTQTTIIGWISTTSATLPTAPNNGAYSQLSANLTTGTGSYIQAGFQRLSLASTTTVFLGALSNFAVSTSGAYGFIGARRVR